MKSIQSKALLIAIAAFAVTATGAYAHGGERLLERADISEEQRQALEEAHQLRLDGDFEAARDRLVEAGVDEETLRSLHRAAHQHKHHQAHWKDELTDEQLEALQAARQANDKETARAILEEAGIERPHHHKHE